KDPSNKVALFWKAQIDDLTGSGADAQRIFEQIVRDKPVKELDAGLPLAIAAEWSLASRALDKQNYEDAIARFQALLKKPEAAELNRSIRWKLATAHAAQGQAKEARREVEQLLSDPKVTSDERVRAADVFRNQGDETSANAQLDLVLKANPAHSGAVAYRSLMLTSKGQTGEAIQLIRSALALEQSQPPAIYLMLAAMENLGDAKAKVRAIEALDEGLKVYPQSIDLLQARYALMTEAKDPNAVAFVEERAKANPTGPARTLLVDIYAERGELDKAREVLRTLIDETPKTSPAAASMLSRMAGFVAAQAAEAARKGDTRNESVHLREADNLIADGRERFPDDLRFPRLECELAARSGDLPRAKRLAQEMADTYASSPVGLVLLGGLNAAEGQSREAARAFEQALGRNPSDVTVRLDLARVLLAMNEADEAIHQAETVLKSSPDLPAAVVLKARALASLPGKPAQVSTNREKALALLLAVVQKNPNLVEAAHLASDIQILQGRRGEGIQTLQSTLKANPQDDAGLSLLVQRLTEPGSTSESVAMAGQLAESYAANDESGVFSLALAVGFQKANRADLALPWAEKAASKIDQPVVHLTYGDVLLAQGEATTEPATSRELLEKAIREYDQVLKLQPQSVEAINNKAWVLHRHFNRNAEALELAEGLTRQRSENDLPPEFLDTLGAIQAAVGHLDDAERTFRKGLTRAPEHPILNFHLGRLLSSQAHRADEAKPYLEKARSLKDALPQSMAVEVDDLLARVAP
ncbi:MAG TPA: tetratricopeptide repeat protein, partial [Isosphaeraceae bacterium]|nr:tetratricopeptide repeat protein [Isosphaeraceae bacterium]